MAELAFQGLRTDQILAAHWLAAGDFLDGSGGLLVGVALWHEALCDQNIISAMGRFMPSFDGNEYVPKLLSCGQRPEFKSQLDEDVAIPLGKQNLSPRH